MAATISSKNFSLLYPNAIIYENGKKAITTDSNAYSYWLQLPGSRWVKYNVKKIREESLVSRISL